MTVQAADFGGQLLVSLTTSKGRVRGVRIESSRPQGATQVFVGQAPHTVTGMLGLLFSLCGRAQTIAGLMALEDAQGLRMDPAQIQARDILRQAEMLTQTTMRLCLDWPRLLGLEAKPEAVRACLAAEAELERALFGAANWKVPGGVDATPDAGAVRTILAPLQEIAAELLRDGGLATHLRAALSDLNLDAFGALSDGNRAEDGALRRQWDAPAVRSARDAFGAGMRARLEARLADLAALPAHLATCVDALGPFDASPDAPRTDGDGAARVDTARGMLVHTVTLRDGRIATYEIAAPTDANFAQDGPVALGLMAADASNRDALVRAAELHVLAIDPCVKCTVKVEQA